MLPLAFKRWDQGEKAWLHVSEQCHCGYCGIKRVETSWILMQFSSFPSLVGKASKTPCQAQPTPSQVRVLLHVHLLPAPLMGVISSGPLEEKGHSYTLINNQPKLLGPVSMGTAAWLRLIFNVVNVYNKSNEDTAEQTSNLCLRGWVHHDGAVSLPAAVAYAKGKSGAGEGSL